MVILFCWRTQRKKFSLTWLLLPYAKVFLKPPWTPYLDPTKSWEAAHLVSSIYEYLRQC